MAGKPVDIRFSSDFQDKLYRQLNRLLSKMANRILYLTNRNLIESKGINTGRMRSTGKVLMDYATADETLIRAMTEIENVKSIIPIYKVGYSVPYAEYIEWGARTKTLPPYEPIKLWVKRKLRKRGKELETVTYRVRKHIRDYGLPSSRPVKYKLSVGTTISTIANPKHYFRRALIRFKYEYGITGKIQVIVNNKILNSI